MQRGFNLIGSQEPRLQFFNSHFFIIVCMVPVGI